MGGKGRGRVWVRPQQSEARPGFGPCGEGRGGAFHSPPAMIDEKPASGHGRRAALELPKAPMRAPRMRESVGKPRDRRPPRSRIPC